MTHSESTQQQTRQIKEELTQLFNQQTDFYRRGGRTKLSASEIAEFDKRRQRIRALFAELEQMEATQASMTDFHNSQSGGTHFAGMRFRQKSIGDRND